MRPGGHFLNLGWLAVPVLFFAVIGTVNAMACADMAMAGIVSRIPPDQVMDAMKEVGDKMDASLRETALGGLAQTEEGMKIAEKMHASYEN
jgi:L-serine dehydratase